MEIITSFPTLWPDRWRVYISSISFVRPPFYIHRGAGLLTSSASVSGAARQTLRKGRGKGGLIISPRFNYVSLQMLSCRLTAQVRPLRAGCGLSPARLGREGEVGGGQEVNNFDQWLPPPTSESCRSLSGTAEASCLQQRPGKANKAASHIFIAVMVIQDLAGGCFGSRLRVFRISGLSFTVSWFFLRWVCYI